RACFFLPVSVPPPDLHSFPTRRSSDLFSVATASGFLTGAGMFGAIIYLPLFVQGVMSASAAESGFALAPLMLGMVGSSTVAGLRSEEHTSELQSREKLVCRLLLEKKKN